MNDEEIGVDIELDEEELPVDVKSDALKGDKGDKGDQGIQGVQGEPGYTPVKGVDYFTNEEIEDIEEDVEAGVITAITPTLNEKANASDVYTKSQIDGELEGKQNKITSTNKLASDLVDDVSQEHKFVTNADKSNWNAKVSDTDYATASKGGVVKLFQDRGMLISSKGELYPETISYSNYLWHNRDSFISKGTLENVITGKNLETATNKVTSLSSSSTDTEYPTAKCVYDYINAQINSAIGGAY